MFIVFTIGFLVIMVLAWRAQAKSSRVLEGVAQQANDIMCNAVPQIQRTHTERFGRASTALEHSFPGATQPPLNKSNA